MRYHILFETRALKDPKKLKLDVQERILTTLRIIKREGFRSNLDIKKLKGYKNQYRLRIGNYRVLFEFVSGDTILIHAILPRKKAYK